MIAPRQTNRLTVFLPFLLFDQMYFTSLRQSRNDKNYRDLGRLTFLAPLHQTPSRQIALLFAAPA